MRWHSLARIEEASSFQQDNLWV